MTLSTPDAGWPSWATTCSTTGPAQLLGEALQRDELQHAPATTPMPPTLTRPGAGAPAPSPRYGKITTWLDASPRLPAMSAARTVIS
jgi:hypothetical protein